jgi:hypothetical protein
LREVENASQLLLAAGQNLDKANPYDFCFKNLNCAVRPVESTSEDYELLMRYVNSCFNEPSTERPRKVSNYRGNRGKPAKKRAYRRPAVQRKAPEQKGWVVTNLFEVGTQASNAVDQKKRERTF